jgi:hypothetical protein
MEMVIDRKSWNWDRHWNKDRHWNWGKGERWEILVKLWSIGDNCHRWWNSNDFWYKIIIWESILDLSIYFLNYLCHHWFPLNKRHLSSIYQCHSQIRKLSVFFWDCWEELFGTSDWNGIMMWYGIWNGLWRWIESNAKLFLKASNPLFPTNHSVSWNCESMIFVFRKWFGWLSNLDSWKFKDFWIIFL